MTSRYDKARAAGIEIRTGFSDYRTPCPVCSPNRRKKRDPCLHITITSDAVLAACFHCDFKGAFHDDNERRGFQRSDRPGAARSAPQRSRWW